MNSLSPPSHFHPIFLLCLSSFSMASLIQVYHFFIEFRFETKSIAKSCSKWVFSHFYILFWPYTYSVNGISNPLSLYILFFLPISLLSTPIHHASRWKFLITLLPFRVFPSKITNLLTPPSYLSKKQRENYSEREKARTFESSSGDMGTTSAGADFLALTRQLG